MAFTLPELPYGKDALAPHLSAETLEFHYGKHHAAYVTNLNKLTDGKPEAGQSLEDLIRSASGGIFNNAAQVYNHTFYWNCLSPKGGGAPPSDVKTALEKAFGSFDSFKEKFTQASATHFGSGWGWLVRTKEGALAIESSSNADCPLRDGKVPVLTCDVWEHAYYIDYRNLRPKYIEAFWNLVDWGFVGKNLAR